MFRRSRSAVWWLWAIASLLAAALPLAGGPWWAVVLDHFRLHLLFVAAGSVLVAAWRRRVWVSAVCLLTVAFHAVCLAPIMRPAADVSHPTLTLIHANIGAWDEADIARLLQQDADVVVLLEVKPENVASLRTLGWPVVQENPMPGGRGTLVFARPGVEALCRLGALLPEYADRPMTVIEAAGVRMLHVNLPRPRWLQQQRDLVAAMPSQDADVIVGDFNATPWSGILAPLRRADYAPTGGWQPTWPAAASVAGLPIDLALSKRPIAVDVLPLGAGDHRAIRVRVR